MTRKVGTDVFLMTLALIRPLDAAAQGTPGPFISGGVSAVFSQESGARIVDPPAERRPVVDRGGTTAAGTIGAGVFLSPRWNIRFELALMGTIDFSGTSGSELFTQISQGETRRNIGSVLLGYEAPASGRVSVGYFAGLALIHERQTFSVSTELVLPLPLPPPTGFESSKTEAWTFRQAPQVGIEAVISATPKVAIVPAFSITAFSGVWLLQPGVTVRFKF